MNDHHNDNETGAPYSGGKPAGQAQREGYAFADPRDLPPVFITDRDHRRLRTMIAENRNGADVSILQFLTHELDRAVLCPSELVPADVVTMYARFYYRRHIDAKLEMRTLVFDHAHSVLGATMSILTPLGAAALGLREGSKIPYVTRDGAQLILSVERVAFQPEREGRLSRAPYRYWPEARRNVHDQDPSDRAIDVLRPHASQDKPGDDDPDPNQAA